MQEFTRRLILLALWILCQILSVLLTPYMVIAILAGTQRAKRIVLAYDQLGNAVTGGSENETISSRAYRGTLEGVKTWCILCRFLNWIDTDHCKKAAE